MSVRRIVKGDSLIIVDENDRPLLSIQEDIGEQEVKIVLKGEITFQVAHEFEDELISVASVCNSVTVDFSGVTFISSAGLKILLSVQQVMEKKKNSSFQLKALSSRLASIFQDTGFAELFEIVQ